MTIKKGTHAPFRLPRILISPSELIYKITFTDSCKYKINEEDQLDINKLFGIGYLPNHHNSSVRFGWVSNPTEQGISIYAYWYANKIRNWQYMGEVPLYAPNYYSISVSGTKHTLQVHSPYPNTREGLRATVDVKTSAISYLLRPYFGGNQKAPHDITIKMV
jgi:hypothetical protein